MPIITVSGPTGPAVAYRFEQDRIAIGRAGDNDLVLGDPDLSRLHAEIRRTAAGWEVEDRGSRNGTRLNGRPLVRPETISPGDRLSIGRMVLVFDAPVEGALVEPTRDGRARPGDGKDSSSWSSRGTGAAVEDATLVGRSPALRAVLRTIAKVARSRATVLITGENGTGKGLVARLIHRRSRHQSGPFAVVNCPALPGSLLEAELFGVEKGTATGVEARRGRVEAARGGTLLLDEVGDMDIAGQAKILQFLDQHTVERVGGRAPIPVDVRILAATNHDLEADIASGTFRRDLYHRLNVAAVVLPPLRERKEDIPLLVEHFLSRPEGPPKRIGQEALELLEGYAFPGNVRELEHLVERARLLADGPVILPADLPDEVRRGPAPARPIAGEASGDSPAADGTTPAGTSDRLYDRVVRAGESFWDVVQRPYLARELTRDEVQRLIERAYRESGYSYKGVAKLFHIETDHKKLLNFLRNQRLGVR